MVHATKQADITQFDFDSGHKYVLVPHTDGPRVFLTTPNNNNRKRISEFGMGLSWIVLHGTKMWSSNLDKEMLDLVDCIYAKMNFDYDTDWMETFMYTYI